MPNKFISENQEKKEDALCVEIVCSQGDKMWNTSKQDFRNFVDDYLVQVGLLDSTEQIKDVHVERIENTYPVYSINYRQQLQSFFKSVSQKSSNICFMGRTGKFWYNNMDHSIKESLEIARAFSQGSSFKQINERLINDRAL